MYLTRNMAEGIYRITVNGSSGTAFCVEKDSNLYFVTARHMFIPNLTKSLDANFPKVIAQVPVEFTSYIGNPFKRVVRVFIDREVDVAVFVLDDGFEDRPFRAFSVSILNSVGVQVGSDVLLAGFPFVWQYGHEVKNPDVSWPYYLPLIRKGILSSIGSVENPHLFLLDVHNNVGFSGCPVFWQDAAMNLHILGIISSFYFEQIGMYSVPSNSGFAVAVCAEKALELISNI